MIPVLIAASLASSIVYYSVFLTRAPSMPRTLCKGLPNAILAATVLIFSDCPTIGAALALYASLDALTSRPNWSIIASLALTMGICFMTGLTFLSIIEQSGAHLNALKIAVIAVLAVSIVTMNITNWRYFGEKNVAVTGGSIVIFLVAIAALALPERHALTSVAMVIFVMSALPFLRETFATTSRKAELAMRRITWPLYYGSTLLLAIDFLPAIWNSPF